MRPAGGFDSYVWGVFLGMSSVRLGQFRLLIVFSNPYVLRLICKAVICKGKGKVGEVCTRLPSHRRDALLRVL